MDSKTEMEYERVRLRASPKRGRGRERESGVLGKNAITVEIRRGNDDDNEHICGRDSAEGQKCAGGNRIIGKDC